MSNKTNLFDAPNNADGDNKENKLIEYYLKLREVEEEESSKQTFDELETNSYYIIKRDSESNKRINQHKQEMLDEGYSEEIIKVLRIKEKCLRDRGRYSDENMRKEMVIDVLQVNQVIELFNGKSEISRNNKSGVPYLEDLDIYENLGKVSVCVDKLKEYLEEEVYVKTGTRFFLMNTEYYSIMDGLPNGNYFASYSNMVTLDRSIWGGEPILLMTVEELKEELENALLCSRNYHLGKLYVENCDREFGEFPKEYCKLLKPLSAQALDFFIETLYSTLTMLTISKVSLSNVRDIINIDTVRGYVDRVKMDDIRPENNPYRFLIEWKKGVYRRNNLV